jgi:hypothetical protein
MLMTCPASGTLSFRAHSGGANLGTSLVFGPISFSAITAALLWVAAASRQGMAPSGPAAVKCPAIQWISNYDSTDEGVAMSGNTLYFADTGNDTVAVIEAAALDANNYENLPRLSFMWDSILRI